MILNRSSNEMFNVKVIMADTFIRRFMGLMLKGDFDGCMMFSNLTDSSVHTMFMRFDIDVYFLDENNTVFEKVTLKPYRFHRPKRQARCILETRNNRVNINVNDTIEII